MKFGYNKLGYNENYVVTNEFFSPKLLFFYIYQPCYNEQIQLVPSCSL